MLPSPLSRPFLRLVGCLLLAAGAALAQTPGRFGDLTYATPPGWTAREQQGVLVLTPQGASGNGETAILVSPAVPLGGEFAGWFEARVRSLNEGAQNVQLSPVETSRGDDGTPVLSRAAVVTVSGAPQYRFFVGANPTGQAVLLMYVAPTLELFGKHQAALNAFAGSLDLVKSAQAGPPPARPAQGSSPGQAASTPAVRPPTPTAAPPPPAVRTLNAAEFVKAGGDPEATLIPGEFRCYEERRGDDVARPHLTVQVLPGGRYRAAGGGGTFTVRKDGSLRKVRWQGGPLGGSDEGYLSFGDHGQDVSLSNVGAQERDYECYQAGAREALARLEFGLKTPKPGQYPCVATDGSNKGLGTLDILPGGRYRLGGAEGRYTVDLLGDQDEDWSEVEFVGGPWDGDSATYQEREDGERRFGPRRTECKTVVKPTPLPRYGTAKAPAPPKGSGGLSGAYASWTSDVGGSCGGLCWSFYIFDKSGYVYTDEPDTGLADADCTRTKPNGLPVCEVYSFKGGQLKIGNGKSEPLRKKPNGDYDLDGTSLIALRPVAGLKLSGTYRSFSGSVGFGGLSSSFSEAFLRFRPDGRFSREASGGFSATFTDTGASSGTTTGGVTATSNRSSGGTYRFVGNTLELKYADGRVVRSFAFLADKEKNGQPSKGFVHIGGRDYTLQTGKE